jgi:tetratricopeptide (TPR) repeat protein
MIDKEGNARILDFGIARSLKAKGITAAGVMVGTPEYMSPEQAEVKEVDQRSDIYSLGVILYEMVTGRVPFEGETPLGIAMKHKGEEPKDPKDLNTQLPEDLNLVILRCLEKDKEKRYQSAGEVRSELSRIEKGIPTTEREIPKRKPITSKEITVTFGLKKLLIPALIVVAVIIAAVIVWRLIPRRERVLAPKIENSIAVISFKNQTGDKAYDYLQQAIPNLLITNLEQAGYLYVATWERMRDLLKQIGKEDVEIIESDLGFELCRREGIEAIVFGSFIKAGDMFATDVKVLDVETKRLLKSASSKGEGVDSILKTQIDELGMQISQGIGIAKQKIEAAQVRIADVSTNSMEAYNYFLRGREEYDKYYRENARQFLEKAVELDPTFASAYLYLAKTHNALGNRKAADIAYEKAKAFSEKATEKERLYIEAAYARAIEKDPEKRYRILKQIEKKYPKEKQVHYFLGEYYYSKGNLEKTIEEHNIALELDPYYGWALNALALTLAEIKKYEKALELFKRYATVSPGDANPFDGMGYAYFRMGRLDEAIAKYKEALEVKPDFDFSLFSIQYVYALKQEYSEGMKWLDYLISVAKPLGIKLQGYWCKGFYHYWLGNLKKSMSELQRAEKLSQEIGNEEDKAFINYIRGWIYYDRGELELSRKYFKLWPNVYIEDYPPYSLNYKAIYSFILGLLDLKQGQIDSAKSRLSEMESLLPKIEIYKDRIAYNSDYLSAEIFLQDGNPDKAIAVLEETSPIESYEIWRSDDVIIYNVPFLKDVLARAYQQKGEIDKAIEEYQRLITFDPKGEERYLVHPKYYYRLGKLYEVKGMSAKAIENYEKFLDLWKDADPGIAEVEDARKRLAGLKSNRGG